MQQGGVLTPMILGGQEGGKKKRRSRGFKLF
jgi:hypothetical protein